MNTFMKIVFLALAASTSTSAYSLKGAKQLQGAASSEETLEAAASTQSNCVPDERPQIQSKSGHKSRFRFNLFESGAECIGPNGRVYEFGEFERVDNSSDCGDLCVNEADSSLSTELRGFNYECNSRVCQCLYDESTLDDDTSRSFDHSNYLTRTRKGKDSIRNTSRKNGSYCFKLVGAELFEEGLEYFFYNSS
eukprot:CAMPEP_0201907842 /NCGR_PEP_ID=MMETSP0903-20130614/51_1 /ASSEMBLY_ACC=CAM_ASM_000552 /TAXON_ID=420261 /ORGANISM="Thalassiosira antarctica, Strain CCMP982" /LENGTH=193 /DNA_ID=CAMNT_0048442017 /DNA_START=114 /DNA_END=695 /DNA_ORIENTATION=+